jgi:hypothetical protein
MPKENDITQEPFVPYKLEEERDKDKGKTFTVWMSDEEYAQLQKDMTFINEPKPSTALKQLAKIGSNLLGSQPVASVIETLFINKRRRDRY